MAAPVLLLQINLFLSQTGISVIVGRPYLLHLKSAGDSRCMKLELTAHGSGDSSEGNLLQSCFLPDLFGEKVQSTRRFTKLA